MRLLPAAVGPPAHRGGRRKVTAAERYADGEITEDQFRAAFPEGRIRVRALPGSRTIQRMAVEALG